MERTRCHICGGEDLLRYGEMGHRRMVSCGSCGHVFAAAFDRAELDRIYARDLYASVDDERIEAWIRNNALTWAGICRTLEKHCPAPRSLLDIGAGSGGFLLEYRRRHPEVALHAVESSPVAREALRKRLPGISFPVTDAAELGSVTDKFNAITILQTLEHVFEPDRLCEEAHGRLDSGGTLLVTVPNLRSYRVLLRGMNDGYCFTLETHLQFFSAVALGRMLRRSGFRRVTRVSEFGGSGNVGMLMRPAQWLLRRMGISTELRFLAFK